MRGAKIVKEVQIKNFRSLKDTKLQTLSPITLLVGENSSGKSSFLRAFPLLKQSIKKRTSGPILWSGDVDDYVDFGSFNETVTNDNSNQIKFRFKFDINDLNGYYNYLNLDTDEDGKFDHIDFEITISSSKAKDFVSFFTLTINTFSINFDIENGKIKLDEDFEYITNSDLVKEKFITKNEMLRPRFFSQFCHAFSFNLPNIRELWEELSEKLLKIIESSDIDSYLFHNAIGTVGELLLSNKKVEKIIFDKTKHKHPSLENYHIIYNGLIELASENVRLQNIIKICYVYMIFTDIDAYIIEYFRNVHYIAPLRATAERYYRLRNLAVDEVDYQGKNLSIFINSLSTKQIKEFNSWTNKHFGFSVSTSKSGGHLSLLIKLKDSEKNINLSDTGFGYSQVLPIITQLWELSSRPRKQFRNIYDDDINMLIPLVVAIEQPELHLHPAVQAKLAKAFIASIELAKNNGYQLQLILETHSETIVNCLGKSIAKKVLNPDDVSIILFEKNKENGMSTVINSNFDKDGYLKNWPYGFFSTED